MWLASDGTLAEATEQAMAASSFSRGVRAPSA